MTCLILALAVVAAQSHPEAPAAIRPPDHAPIMSGVSAPTLNPAEGEIIYDSLCIMDNPWEAGNGDTCGGSKLFGFDYDLQAADDFTLEQGATLTGVAMDYLTFLGECPETLCISVFDGTCGDADDDPYVYIERAPDACIDLVDPYGAYLAKRFMVKGDLFELPAGRWYITMNPKFGDWAYVVTDLSPLAQCGDDTCDVLLRDGSFYNPCCRGNGWDPMHWFPSANYWGVHSTMSMQIQVRYGPERARCVYEVRSVRSRPNLCGEPCDVCRYALGDTIATMECPDGGLECTDQLTGFETCANGATCHVRADFLACEAPPHGSSHCGYLVMGACCLPDNGGCTFMSEESCRIRNGTFHAGQECKDVQCP